MASVNRVTIIGNLGKDPEMRTFPSGDMVTNITVATTDKWKDKQSGEQREATEWHRITFNGRLAEIANEYLRKGAQVYVEGSLRTRKWTDQSGVEKYTTEIRADNMQMLGGRPQDGGQGDGHGRQAAPRQQQDQQYQQAQQPQQPRQAQQQVQQPRGYTTPSPQQGGYQQPQQRQPAPRDNSGFDNMDDDIPFRDPLSYRGAHLVL